MGLLTPDGVLVETNRTSIEHEGVSPEDVLGKVFWEGPYFRHSAEQQARVREGIARAAQGEIVRFEVSYQSQAGLLSSLDFTLTPLYDDDGRIINIIHEARDISELTRTRDALGAAEERLRTASSGASIGLYDWVVDSNERWYNDVWFTMLGYAPQEFPATRQTMIELCHPDDAGRVTNGMDDYINGGVGNYRMEFRMRAKSGEWRWILSQASAVRRDVYGRALRIAGLQMDITDRKTMETQLASAQRLESIGQLAAGVAHEINTPVQYVNDSIYFVREGMQELLALVKQMQSANPDAPPNEELQYLQENLPAALDRAVEGLGRVSEIVRSMKEFSHPDNKSMEPFDINRGIQSTLVVARNEYKFVADAETRLGEVPAVTCRGGEINQVILNLVVNGAHAIADRVRDSGERGRIVVETRCDGDDVLISVSDTGGGIPESVRHRIFEPFFTTKEVGKGTGQGLAIANSVVRAHGGSLSFQTEMGVGTTFLIRLPIKPVQQAEQVEAA
jgi:PAS domain S-box-containing protein